MRIAIVTTSKIPSKTANSIQVMKVCQAYRELGHDVILFVPGTKKASWAEISKNFGIKIEFPIKYIKSFRVFRRYDFSIFIAFYLMFNSFDLVHTWLPQIALLAGMLKIPYIMELHGLPTGKFGPYLHKKLFFSDHKKRFLCITKALRALFEQEYDFKFRDSELVIAPNGVSLDPYTTNIKVDELRSEFGLLDQFSAVYTGHLYQGRGMTLLVELAKIMQDVQFLWVGGREEDVQYWKNVVQKLGIKNLKLTGFVNNDEIPSYQLLGDVLLMPYENIIAGSSGGNSVEFCSPMKMFEYMAAGKPIISSNLPILHEVLNEKNAIFCDFDKVDQWVNAINQLRLNPKLASKIGKKAKQDVEQFTWIMRTKNSLDGFVS